GHAFLAQQARCDLEIAVRVLERPFAVHHPRAGPLPELLDEAGRDLGHSAASVASPPAAGAATGSSDGASSDEASSAGAGSSRPAVSSSSVTRVFAAAMPSAIARTTSEHERIASSFPGTTYVASSGSQLVSTSAITGSPRR